MATFFDRFWEQNVKRFGGFSSLNMRDEQNLKAIIHSLLTKDEQKVDIPAQSATIDYEELGMVMYCAVKAALSEVSSTRLQTYAVPDAIKRDFDGTTDPTELPSAFFASNGDNNLDSIQTDTVESSGIGDTLNALKQMQGDS